MYFLSIKITLLVMCNHDWSSTFRTKTKIIHYKIVFGGNITNMQCGRIIENNKTLPIYCYNH